MRHRVQLVLAALSAVAAAVCWRHATSLVDVPPITDGQPATVSVVYAPPLLFLCWLLATTAGVLAVLGVAGIRRGRLPAALGAHTP